MIAFSIVAKGGMGRELPPAQVSPLLPMNPFFPNTLDKLSIWLKHLNPKIVIEGV